MSDKALALPEQTLPAAQVVRLRFNWYRDGFRVLLAAQLVTLLLLCAMTAAALFFYSQVPPPEYFATTHDGRLIRLQPLSRPVFAPSAVMDWAVTSVVKANDYNFRNYREHLQEICNARFTYNGCSAFKKALTASRNLAAVRKFGLVVTAQHTRSPIIVDSGVQDSRFYWHIQLPVLITVESTQQHRTQRQLVTLRIVRVPTLDSEYGIAIDQYIAEFGAVNS